MHLRSGSEQDQAPHTAGQGMTRTSSHWDLQHHTSQVRKQTQQQLSQPLRPESQGTQTRNRGRNEGNGYSSAFAELGIQTFGV